MRKIGEYSTQQNADILWLQDMQREDFQFVSEKLGKQYMEETKEIPAFPVEGFIYGKQLGRKCVLLTVKRNNKCIWVPFAICAGSPNIILGHDALLALDINPTDVCKTVNVNIHGFDTLTAYHEAEDKRLRNVNLIGWAFFRDTDCYEFMHPETMTLRLYMSRSQFMKTIKNV